MSTVRWIGLVGSFAAAGLAGLMMAAAARTSEPPPQRPGTAVSFVEALIAPEVQLATSLSMTPSQQGEEGLSVTESGAGGLWSRPIDLAARECVAVVAGVTGHQRVESLALRSSLDPADQTWQAGVVSDAPGMALVAHVQWCTWEPRRLLAVLRTRAIDNNLPPRQWEGQARWRVLRGSWATVGGTAGLRRGTFSDDAVAALGVEPARERAVALGALPNATTLPIEVGAARLVPANERAWATLNAAVRGDTGEAVNPRVDAQPVSGAPFATGLPLNFAAMVARESGGALVPVHDAVVPTDSNRFRRVLASVDPERLGPGCWKLQFVRLRYGAEASLGRFEPGTRRVTSVTARENLAADERCAASGPVLYVTSDSDHAPWELRVSRAPVP